MRIQIALFAVLSFACSAFAQQSDSSNHPASVTREQWKARVDAAKSRIQEMRREGKSFISPPEENLMITKGGMFQFVGGAETPHNLEDFRQVAPDQVFPKR
jgi:hypothetical protein